MTLHPYNKGQTNHAITAKTYLTEAARDLDLAWHSTKNLNKVVRIADTNAYQILVSVGPPVWQALGLDLHLAEAGVGITAGTDTLFGSGVTRVGSMFKTEIIIDLDGLHSTNTDDDVIGVEGAGAAHMGQITVAKNGTIFMGRMTCIELPAGGQPDIALWATDDNDGVEDTLVTAMANQVELVQSQGDGTAWAAGDVIDIPVFPVDGKWLYLVSDGAITDGEYTAGKFLIEFWGV